MILPGAFVALAAGWVVGIGICRAAARLIWLRTSAEDRPDAHPVGPAPDHLASRIWSPAGRRLLVRAATAVTSAALWLHYGPDLALALPLALAWLLLLIAAVDLEKRLVLNELLLAGTGLAFLRIATSPLSGAAHGWYVLLTALTGGVVALGLFLIVAMLRRGSLGAGDVKLAGLLGLFLGFPDVLRALAWGMLIGGLVAGALFALRKVRRGAMIPYAPFLAAGGILALLVR